MREMKQNATILLQLLRPRVWLENVAIHAPKGTLGRPLRDSLCMSVVQHLPCCNQMVYGTAIDLRTTRFVLRTP